MRHNAEIADVMNAIIMRIMPASIKIPDAALWEIYTALQEWKLNIEWDHPGIGRDMSVAIARTIVPKLKNISNPELAQKIASMIQKYTPDPQNCDSVKASAG